MKQRMRYAAIPAIVISFALALPGCDDSEVTAPTDGFINLSVNPSTIVLDPNTGATSADAQVIAAVFDSEGQPLQNVSVLFSTGGGTLASRGAPVKTNASGIAGDTLTVVETDPDSFQVIAQSSSIIVDADVTKTVVADNEEPLASILESPAGSAEVGALVTYDGSTSVDPDGTITCFQWSIDSTNDAADELVQGRAVSALQRTYNVEQTLSIVLRVSDRADAGAQCVEGGTPVPVNLFSSRVDTLQYSIVCKNSPPVADAGPDQTVFVPPNTNPTSQVLLDGTRSLDSDGTLERYVWNCGNGVPPFTAGLPPGQAYCTYRALGEYVATLTVYDNGDGTVSGGTFRCQKSSTDEAVVKIAVTP